MKKFKYLILGAGPAGLSYATRLAQNGETSFLVLEKEDCAGGLCRSVCVDESPFDIGGGHFLDVKNPKVTSFLFDFLPEEEWDIYSRDSRIDMGSYTIGSPIEANIWQMPEDISKEYLDSISSAGCNTGAPIPDKFTDWIYWKLGKRIAEDYMLPYNMKMFGENLNSLGNYWLAKLPNVSYEETLRSCEEHKAYGTQPGHAKFYYPKKYGYGEVWLRMAEKISEHIIYNEPVKKLDAVSRTVNDIYQADKIICTIPWTSIENLSGAPDDIPEAISQLKYTSVVTEYFADNLDTDAQWIYYPDLSLDYHRILVRHNFCPNSRGYWTETNSTRFKGSEGREHFINEYAYPLNTLDKPELMNKLLSAMGRHDIIGLGRWGEWQHYNSDAVVIKAIELADEHCKKQH